MKNHKSHKLSDLNINGAISEVYLMDCVEAMKQYPDNYFNLVCVDPPYGIDIANMSMGAGKSKKASNIKNRKWKPKCWDKNIPSKEYFKELFRVSKNQIIWGGNYFHLPPCNHYLIWDKEIPEGLSFADCEFAWTSFKNAPRIFRYSAYLDKKEKIHPTQKSVSLYSYIFKNYAKEGDLILDTHLGSQSSRIAANKANLDFIGFEIDEDYFNDGNKRFKTFVSQMRLF